VTPCSKGGNSVNQKERLVMTELQAELRSLAERYEVMAAGFVPTGAAVQATLNRVTRVLANAEIDHSTPRAV
jgi:hypothetical protein